MGAKDGKLQYCWFDKKYKPFKINDRNNVKGIYVI